MRWNAAKVAKNLGLDKLYTVGKTYSYYSAKETAISDV